MKLLEWLLALFARAAEDDAPEPNAAPLFQRTLTDADYLRAAERLGCDVATVRAVAQVESRGAAFLDDQRPVILFEAHIFQRLTNGRFAGMRDRSGVSLSAASWDRSLYGAAGAHQWDRYEDAAALDASAAARSCSWGMFQVMGFNHAICGYPTIDAFVSAMRSGAGAHLDAFCGFVLANSLAPALRSRDWERFARGYNGPDHAANDYVGKLTRAYAEAA